MSNQLPLTRREKATLHRLSHFIKSAAKLLRRRARQVSPEPMPVAPGAIAAADNALWADASLRDAENYVVRSHVRGNALAGASREVRDAVAEFTDKLVEMRGRYLACSDVERSSVLREVQALVRATQGGDLTGVPLRVGAKQFVEGRCDTIRVMDLAAQHFDSARRFPRSRSNVAEHDRALSLGQPQGHDRGRGC